MQTKKIGVLKIDDIFIINQNKDCKAHTCKLFEADCVSVPPSDFVNLPDSWIKAKTNEINGYNVSFCISCLVEPENPIFSSYTVIKVLSLS